MVDPSGWYNIYAAESCIGADMNPLMKVVFVALIVALVIGIPAYFTYALNLGPFGIILGIACGYPAGTVIARIVST